MKRSAPDDGSASKRAARRRGGSPPPAAGEQERGHESSSSAAAAELPVAAASARASSSSSGPQGSAQPQSTLTYPNPKSFAEKLMFVLESHSCPDTIWWEENGRTVALHVDNLKTNSTLNTYFQGIQYKFFIRNFSRWGFKRDTSYTVPFGRFHYSNSLFRRDQPHLVKHMRMDSDVQDIFARHQGSPAGAPADASSPQRRTITSRRSRSLAGRTAPTDATAPASAPIQREVSEPSSHSQEQKTSDQPVQNQQQDGVEQLLNNQALLQSSAEQQVDINGILSTVLPLMALGQQRSEQQAGTQQRQAQPEALETTVARNALLQTIVEMSGQYLNISSSSPTTPFTVAIRILLQLVHSVAQQYFQQQQLLQQQQQQQQQQSVANNSELQQLLGILSNHHQGYNPTGNNSATTTSSSSNAGLLQAGSSQNHLLMLPLAQVQLQQLGAAAPTFPPAAAMQSQQQLQLHGVALMQHLLQQQPQPQESQSQGGNQAQSPRSSRSQQRRQDQA